jgi:glycosyltransferase involved in cell wall biosynthesis
MTNRHLRVLMPSIVDPAIRRGGAWTVTRGLVELFRRGTWQVEVTTLVPPEPLWRRLRQAACLATAHWSGIPAKIRFLHHRAFRDQIRRELAREHFDLLVINGSDLFWCLDEAPPAISTLVVVHNREWQLYEDQVATTIPCLSFLQRLLLADSRRLRQFELEGLRRVQAAIFLSESDAADFSARIPELHHLVLPPQFPDAPRRVSKNPSGWLDLGLLANFHWWPNRDGAHWFINQILSCLPCGVRLHLFGNGSLETAGAHSRIVAHGFVDDLEEVWAACDWMLIPIRHGSGISVKAAESLYHGMPILSTSFGLRGLPAMEHPQIVRRETAEEWVSFLSSPESRTLCNDRVPLSVSRHFELEANVSRFVHFLSCLLRLKRPHLLPNTSKPTGISPSFKVATE